MDPNIKSIIDEYLLNVNKACSNLLKEINTRENLKLKTKQDFFEYRSNTGKMEFFANGSRFQLHGRGCFVFSDKLFLNWDFGYRSRWCGIDPWMLGMTLKENRSEYVQYYDGNLLQEACEQALLKGEMFKKRELYYFSIPIDQTFSPDFPKNFDTLIVEYLDFKWVMPRNKLIDRFLRKSVHIYNQIYCSENSYLLRFFLQDREVYTIPYDDICYPESAIKIMSDQILRNLREASTNNVRR